VLQGERMQVSIYSPEACELTSRHSCRNTGTFSFVPERDLDTFVVIDAMA
jgi:hypothetical protein